MTNIEDNTDKRFQQLSKATGLTTQSAKDNTFKQASAFSEEFIKKFRESFPGIDVNIEVIVTSEEKKKSEYANKTGKNTESEDWLKYVVEKSATLGNQIFEAEAEISTLKSKAEELNEISFSKLVDSLYILDKENEKIETYTKQNYNIYKEMKGIEAKLNQREGLDNIGGESLTSGLDFVLGLTEAPSEENKNAETYLEKFEEAYKTGKDALEKAITFTKVVQGASIVAGAAGGALTGVAIIIVYGALWAKDHEVQNAKDWEKIVKENSTVDGQIAILEAIKADLGREKPVINPELLNNIIHLAQLKTMMEKVVANQYNEKLYKEGIADIDYYVDSLLINLKDTEKNQLRERSYAQENNDLGKLAFEGMYNDPKQEILPKLKDETNPMYRFITEYKQAIEEMYKSLTVNNQSEIPGSLIPCIQKTKEEIKELEKENIFETFLDNYERAMEKAPKVWDILGIDDEAKIKQEISKVQNLLTVDGTGVDTKENSEKLKVSSEEKEAAKKVAEMKREEENAMRNLVNVMNHFGNNLIAVGEGLNSSFLKNSGYTVNAFSSITDGFNLFKDNGGLSSITGMFKGGMAGSVKGLESITGALTSVSGIIAGVNVLSSLTSSLSGKDKKKKIEKSNEENKQAFENSTTTLLSFVEAIKANISAINSYSSTLLGYATNNTTLSGIAKVEKNFDLYIKAMVDGTKNFGTVTGLVKSKTKYKSWFKSKSADTYEAVEVKEADILKSMGITNTTIDNMDENQLRDFAEKLKTTGRGDLLISLVDSNFEEWKEGIYEYVGQINKLREEQEQLFRNSTLNAFEGIDVSSYKSLIQEYTQMFEDMGLNADAYKDTIEEMARNAQVLVTAMQDVRNSFVEALSSGEASDFSSSMSSYFKKIPNNAAQVTYDVAYSSIDEYMTKEFEKISEKLVDMKKSGVLNFDGFWDDFNFNKILEADRITTDYEKVINDLRTQLENRGFSSSLIDSMLPTTELSERIESIKSMLSSAMSEALNNNSFASFEESLGNSIYESVKDSLIQAFVDSEVYRTYMNQFYNMDDIKEKLSQAANAQQGFGLMQDYLKDLEYELEKMGLNRGNAASGNSTEENTLGNSYYQDSGIEYNITIEQHFSGVYGFDAMYDVAKQGATEAIEEWKNQGKVISAI
ncbi:hypothetical protein DXA30_01290 [Fusobacterium ulcerans]|uniref:hypothetical protein n=1 Tax=Fusobacterium ulcerans TaxID=861 RepID=UPI000E4B5497|nr:hypothetical protein [Fusobacterium ulcerans]RGY67230.1 hypothetical protein DXA30_01290 [Fusobacterium ulcerans]